MIVRKLGIADYPAVNALFAVAFETTPENGPAREEDAECRLQPRIWFPIRL